LLFTAALTFGGLLLLVGETAKPSAAPMPRPVSALDTKRSVPPSGEGPALAVAAKAKSKRPKHKLDSFEQSARAQARRARKQLRDARKRTIGLQATPRPRAPRVGSGGSTTAAPQAQPQSQTTTTPATPKSPTTTTPATLKSPTTATTPTQTQPVPTSNTGGTSAGDS
jgi:hypothetical protein